MTIPTRFSEVYLFILNEFICIFLFIALVFLFISLTLHESAELFVTNEFVLCQLSTCIQVYFIELLVVMLWGSKGN